MGKTRKGGGRDRYQDYDGTNAPEEGSDFWSDYDMWAAMREADEIAISREADEAQAQADVFDAELLDEIDGRLDLVDGQPALLNNIDLALEAGRSSRDHWPSAYGTTSTVAGNCRGCGQRYGHSIMCPVVNPNVTMLSAAQAKRREDAVHTFSSREYKDWSKGNRGGADRDRGTKPTAVLVDMDGTIDDYGKPNRFGIDYVRRMHKAGHVIVVCTARTMEYEFERSHKWLVKELSHKYGIPFVGPFCRSRDDMRFACYFKKGTLEALSSLYTFVGAIDDDTHCLRELRTIKDLDVVTAQPGPVIAQPYRRTYKGPKKARHARQEPEA